MEATCNSGLGKKQGKHPTQKPLSLLVRLILASTKKDAWIMDPFTGSSTTGIAANLVDRNFIGIDNEKDFLKISQNRKLEIENPQTKKIFMKKIPDTTFFGKEIEIEF